MSAEYGTKILIRFYIVAGIVFLADQLTKLWALWWIRDHEPIELVNGFFTLRFATNRGGAFSLFSDHFWIITVVSTIVALLIWYWQTRIPRDEVGTHLALGLVFGGALGNLLDRYVRGEVIDFIDLHWRELYHWPTFNLADTCISIGIFWLALIFLFPQLRFFPGTRQVSADGESTPD